MKKNVPKNSVCDFIGKRETSSSISTIHFGHYKAGARSEILSYLHALKVSVALKNGVSLSRWAQGLSVMLEKENGCTLLSKLRAILPLEADSNFAENIIYEVLMMKMQESMATYQRSCTVRRTR